MRIESSNLNMQGSSSAESITSVQESLNMWTSSSSVSLNQSSVDVQEFSQQATNISSASSVYSALRLQRTTADEVVYSEHELKLKLLQAILSTLTGKKVNMRMPKIRLQSDGYDKFAQAFNNLKLISLSDSQQLKSGTGSSSGQSTSGFGLIYNRNETQIEKSRVTFAAQGVVKTADGKEINLNVNYNIDQEIINQSSFQLRAGEALTDPLVINFGGSVASFSDRTMSFDLDYDGDKDTVQMLNSNSGYLALDNNNNGQIDDGTELFGPQTDNGYGELAKYDEDGNGWIDEGDSVFNHLKIWYQDEQGNSQLVGLTDKNVGAIYLGNVDTEMDMYSQTGMSGALKRSGVVLMETGETRIMQELDLKI